MARSKTSSVLRSSFGRHKATVFGFCLLLSCLFWILLALNEPYTTKIRVAASYINMPENSMLIEKLPKEVEMLVSGNGYDLISHTIQPKQSTILIDGRSIVLKNSAIAKQGYLTTFACIDYFNRENFNIKALNILPDTIFFSYFERGYKKVPIHLNAYLKFDRQFSLSDNTKLKPDSILLSGPIASIDSITKIETEPLIIQGLNKSGDYKVNIKKTNNLISYSASQINVHIEVDKFTEASMDVPISIEHFLNDDSLEIFPKNVKVTYLVSLRNYSKVNAQQFKITADALEIRKSKTDNLRLFIKQSPSTIQNVRIVPEIVNYIIRRKKDPKF